MKLLTTTLFLILLTTISAYDSTIPKTCTATCTSNCSVCNNAICLKCQLGSTLVAGGSACSANVCPFANCTACDINGTVCLRCADPYSIFDKNSSACVQSCGLSNCAMCVAGSSSCRVCNSGFSVYSLTNKCIPVVISSCLNMHDFRNVEYRCTRCAAGYLPSSDQTECIADTCSTIRDCVTCAVSSVCDVCKSGYSVVNGSCVANLCTAANCLYCDAGGSCLKCQSSYSLSSTQCVANPCLIANCKLCKPGSIYCDSCASGLSYNIWTNVCEDQQVLKSQPINCELVQTFRTGLFSCVKCLDGFDFATSNRIACISSCPANCLNCSSQTNCTVCNSGYLLSNGSCTKIQCLNDTICSLCDQNQFCLQCKDPYAVYNYVSLTCVQFCRLPNCELCSANSKTCLQCAPNYAIYSWNGSCVYSVIKNCLVLHDWRFQEFQCTKCASGYKPSKDQTECILGYCPLIKECQICTNSSICLQCRIGFSFEKTECVPNKCNVTNCLYCSEEGRCLRSFSNFTLVGEKIEAFPCKLANCSSCKQSSMFCETCAKGYAFGIWNKTCEIDPLAHSGPNLKYLWLLSIGVVIIIAVVILVCVYQKGKKVDSSNKVKPTLLQQAPNTNLQNQKDTLDNFKDSYQSSPPKGPLKLPPIRRVEQMTPTQDVLQATHKQNFIPDFT